MLVKANLKVVGFIPNFNRQGSYPEFGKVITPVQAVSARPKVSPLRVVTDEDIKRANQLKYKKGVIKAWKKANRNHVDVLLCSSSIN